MHLVDALLEALDLFTERFEQRIHVALAGAGKTLAFLFEDTIGQVLEFFDQRLTAVIQLLQLLTIVFFPFLLAGLQCRMFTGQHQMFTLQRLMHLL